MSPNESTPERADARSLGRQRVPLHELLGIRPVAMVEGRGRLEFVVKEQHLRTFGILHGGVFATLLDTVMGMASASVARDGHDVVTVQLNVNFIRPVALGESIVATSEVVHAGRRTAVARAEIRTAGGELAATGTGTFMFLPPTGAAQGGIGPVADADADTDTGEGRA